MPETSNRETGLRLGLIVIAGVALGFFALLVFGPATKRVPPPVNEHPAQTALLDVLADPETRRAVETLKSVSPATFAALDAETKKAIAGGADEAALSVIVLEALFAQFQTQAFHIKGADSVGFQSIIAGLSDGLGQLKITKSAWCNGGSIAAFLTQNDADLVPSLLAEFPYGSPQYAWAMEWMTTILSVARRGQDQPRRYPRPGFRDETVLQQEGLALGSEQWALGLQIAAFANSEGTSYSNMQEVIAGMDVCDLGIAVETVSGRLPDEVRARIWADLMPEIMVGNTPYVMYRVTDYFFIG